MPRICMHYVLSCLTFTVLKKNPLDKHIIVCLYEDMINQDNPSTLDDVDENMLCELAELFKIFGDSTRCRILYALLGKEMSVTEISDSLGMTQPAISQQLRVLKSNGLLKFRRDGKSIIYSLADEHVNQILSIGLEHLGDR